MFDLFGNNNRKSLKQMMDELNEMFGDYNPNFKSSSMEHKSETGNDDGMDWEKQVYTTPDGKFTYIITSSSTVPPKKNKNSLESLKQQLDKAVEKEDFQLAISLRDKIKTFERDHEDISADISSGYGTPLRGSDVTHSDNKFSAPKKASGTKTGINDAATGIVLNEKGRKKGSASSNTSKYGAPIASVNQRGFEE